MSNRIPAPGEVLKALRLAERWPDSYPSRLAGLRAALTWVMSEDSEASKPTTDSRQFFASLPKRPRPPHMRLLVTANEQAGELLTSTLATADADHRAYYEAVHECLAWIVGRGSRPVELE